MRHRAVPRAGHTDSRHGSADASEIYPPEEEGCHPVAVGRTLFVDSIDRGMAETIVAHLQASSAQMAVAQLQVLGGAMARVPTDATAFAHRARRIMVNVAAVYARADQAAQHTAWANDFAVTLRQGASAAYVNFLDDEGAARVRAAYPGATWEHLRAIKAHYDPTNLFRLNQNIPPAIEDPRQ
jgi:FAD/FMN-containing dehydrogenase